MYSGITFTKVFFSTTITGVFVIGSLKKLPVSIIALIYAYFEFILTFILQCKSFLVNFPFIFLNAVVIIINPIIPATNIIFIGYVPTNTPFHH